MKYLLAFPLALILVLPGLSALDTVFLEPVAPTSPALKAQGGTSTANATGFDALFANPAAFSETTTEITFLSQETSALVPLSGLNKILDARDSWSSFPTGGTLLNTINSLLKESTVGQEFSAGSAWVGNNLGVGLAVQQRVTAHGPNLLDAKSRVDITAMGVVGMGWPFDVGLGTLRLGGAIRPMQRMIADIPATALLKNFTNLGAFDVYSGFGMGLDLGLRWDYADFRSGLVLRDISGSVLNLQKYSESTWQNSLGFPTGGDGTGSTIYRIPTVLGLGTAWTPDVGSLAAVFQPSLTFDLQVPFKDEFTQTSFWTWTHLGAEAKLLRFYSLRAGLNQGYLTFGMGARFLLFDMNLAVYSDELGRFSGLNRRSAISLQWAVKL